jgi:long-chain fatty acid transport protein
LKNPTFKIAAAAMMVAGAFATQTYAAGFQLSEQSAIQMGRAMAGAGVVGDDLSAVHYNPAGMTLLSGTRMQATGTWVAVNLDYKGDSGQSENGRLKGQTIPAGFITHQINDSLWAGLGLTVPYGMGTEYGEGWKGKSRGTESMILTFDINPNLAWKVNDMLSVGGGISLQYAKAELGMGMGPMQANVKGDSWAWGWNVGLMFQPVETVRLGLAYRSHIAHNADGHTTLNNVPNATGVSNLRSDMEVRLKTPDTITLSATWEATDALRLSGTARWSKWSNFRSLNVQNLDLAGTKLGTTVVENNWDDTWFFSVGADYKLNGQWTVRGGVAYDQGPVENQYRMAVIPDTDRVWFSGGASYKYTDNLTFDFGATYIKGVGDTDLYDKVGGKKIGEFKSLDSYIFSAQMQYLF